MNDDQSSPTRHCPDQQRQSSYDFFRGRGGHGFGCGRAGRSLFTRGEITSGSREVGGGNEFDSINSGVSEFNKLLDGSATPIPTSSPDKQEKIQLRERSLNTSPLPLITFTVEESKQSMEEIGAEAAPQQPPDHRPPRRASRFQSAPFQPASEGKSSTAEEIQAFCQLQAGFCTSLFHGLQSILSNISHAPLCPGLEGLSLRL